MKNILFDIIILYFYNPNNQQWIKSSYDNTNFLIMTTLEYKEFEPPQFMVGYIQNPIYSENIDIYLFQNIE